MILAHFSFMDAKPYGSPMIPGAVYSKKDAPSSPEEASHMEHTLYHQAIGSLMYTAIATHPNTSFTISALSHFLANPGNTHWEAVKHVFHYLKGTKDLQLTYGSERQDLQGYTDADGSTQEDQQAMSGYTFLINRGTISWSARRQELITLSTAEVEYVAATHAAKEAKWLHKLFGKLFPHLLDLPMTLFLDNQSVIKLTTTDNYHAWTKHLDQLYHFIHNLVSKQVIKLVYCPSEDMVMDTLTKALLKWKVVAHASSLGMCCKVCALWTIQDTAVCHSSQSSSHRASHPVVRSQASHTTISDDRHIVMCVSRQSATTGQSCDPLHSVSDHELSG